MKTDMGSKRRNVNRSTCGNLSSVELITGGDIPEWMLFEVFVRLPVKVLFKFKIVSKRWFSMISDPAFARMYVALLPHSQHWTLICGGEGNAVTKNFLVKTVRLHECSLGTNCLQHRLILPCARQVDDLNYRIVGVSNGFVLYAPPEEVACCGRIYRCYICNIITGKWITLSPHAKFFNYVFTGFVTQVEDNVLASYRVVLIDSRIISSVNRFVVYFSEICKWVDFDIDFNQETCFYWCKKAVVLHKILHRMIGGHKIMAYDPYNKPDSSRLISLPGVTDEIDVDESLLDEHQGYLRYFVVSLYGRPNEFSGSLIIWVLNDYDQGEWCLQHRVSISDIQSDGGLSLYTEPLSFHPFEADIVYMINDEALLSYNIKTKTSKIMDDFKKNYLHLIPFCYWYLYVIPPWPASINSSPFKVTKD